MSGVLKSIGKVFKAVVKVAKVVLPIALAAAAIVFTGGAALGLTPTFAGAIGGLVSHLGLSVTLAGALTGSVVSAGFGAAAGLVTGGVKGAQKGALIGGATGGLLGAANPATFGFGTTGALKTAATTAAGVGDAGSAVANASKGLLSTAVPGLTAPSTGVDVLANSVGPGIDTGFSSAGTASSLVPSAVDAAKTAAGAVPASAGVAAPAVSPAAAPAVASKIIPSAAAAVTPAAPVASNGLMSGLLSNPAGTLMAGNLLTGLFTPSQAQQEYQYAQMNGQRLFGGAYSGTDPFGNPDNYGTPRVGIAAARRFRLNPQTLQVEEVRGP